MEGRSRTKSGGGGGDVGDAEPSEAAQKPKIWSLAHTATSDSPPSARRSLHQQHQQQQQLSHPPAPPSLHPHHLTQSGFFFARPWHDAGAFMQRGGYPLTGVAPITAATRLTAPTPIMPPMMSPLTPHKVRLTPADEHRRRSEPCHLALTERTSQSSPSSSSSSSSPVGDSQRDVNARKVVSLQQGSSPLPPIPTSG
ncbi:PREDICTED: homeobox protein caupolican-like [Priapulus caudatus]|uniref:Homeobox protein caupolican-like n=1 Tax=Priapulus caudatus TaxID=37621 RepID=A0ABM1EV63_PRICU|nr:PREDICTED: homeobox protein caupolican-like [Priapulus caudatus]